MRPTAKHISAVFVAVFGMMMSVTAWAEDKPVATLTIEQYQAAWVISGNLGGGKLSYKGKTYDFKVGGMGVGGFGVSKIEATGKVFKLKNLSDFPGVYGQARYGGALADKSTGKLWLQNTNGVVIELEAKRTGLALSMGADGVVIDFDN
jgi:hypothetical protein